MDNTTPYPETLQKPLDIQAFATDNSELNTKKETKTPTKTGSGFIPSPYTKKLLERGSQRTMGEELADYELDNNLASYGLLDGIQAGFKSSLAGTAYRYSGADSDNEYHKIGASTDFETAKIGAKGGITLTDDELLEIAKEANYDPGTIRFALVGSSTMDEVREKLAIRKENDDINQRLSNSSTLVNIASGLANMAGDPIMLASMAIPLGNGVVAGSRLATFGARAGFNAATQVPLVLGSEYLNHVVTGRETDYWGAAYITAGIGTAFALGAFRRGAVRGVSKALEDPNLALKNQISLNAADDALAAVDSHQLGVAERLVNERKAASAEAAKANTEYRTVEQERVQTANEIERTRNEVPVTEALLEDAKKTVKATHDEAERAYQAAQERQLQLEMKLETSEKSLAKQEAEIKAKITEKETDLRVAETQLSRAKAASEKLSKQEAKAAAKAKKAAEKAAEKAKKAAEEAKEGTKKAKKGGRKAKAKVEAKPTRTTEHFIRELTAEIENKVKRLKSEIHSLKHDAGLAKARKEVKELRERVKWANNNTIVHKNARTAKTNAKIKAAEAGLKQAEELVKNTKNRATELIAKHKELVAKSKTARTNYEAARGKVRKLRTNIQRLQDIRKKTRGIRSEISTGKKIPLETAVQLLTRQARISFDEALKARLGQTASKAASSALKDRGLMKEGDDLAKTLGYVTESDVKAARDATARTTDASLANQVESNPELKSKFSQLLSNPTKALELKAYFVALLDNPRTPQSVKDLIRKLVHFEEGVMGADGRYHQYQSSAPTYMETFEGFRVEDTRYIDQLNALDNKIRATYPEERLDEISDYIYCSLEGNTRRANELALKYGKDENIQKFIEIQKKSYEERGAALRSRGILADDADSAVYSPLVIDMEKLFNFLSEHFSGNVDGAKKFLAKYLVDGVLKNPTFRDRMLKRYLDTAFPEGSGKIRPERLNPKQYASFEAWVSSKAKEAADGYIDQGRSIPESVKLKNRAKRIRSSDENYDDFTDGFAFLKSRMPWNSGHVMTIDGKTFSVNDLRVDPIDAHNKYRARSTGVLTDYDTFGGRTYDEVEEMFFEEGSKLNKANNMKPNVGEEFRRNVTMLHKRTHGISVTETQEAFGILDAAAQIVRNLAFCSFGTYMGLNSLMEMSRALRATGFTAVLKLVPFAGRLFDRWAHNGFTSNDVASIRGYLLGQTMRPLLGYHTALHSGVRKYSSATRSSRLNSFIGKIVGATDYLADHSPAGLLLRGINTKIDDVFETYGLKELIQRAFDPNAKVSRGCFMSDDTLRSLNIPKEDFDNMLKELKEYFIMDKRGRISLNPNKGLEEFAANNPKSLYILRRLMKNVRETTMQRRNIDDIFLYERSSKNSIISLAMQFKAFSIQSYRKRAVKSMHQFVDGEADLVAEQYLISAGLAGLVTLGTTYVRGLGMSDEDKERYYERTLGVSSFDDLDDPNNVATLLGRLTVNRMSETASFSLLANMMGIGAATKTTYNTPGFGQDEDPDAAGNPLFLHRTKIGDHILGMFPAINATQNIVSGATGAINAATTNIFDTGTTYKQDSEETRLLQSIVTSLPNMPFVSNYLKDKIEEAYSSPF